MAAPMPATIGVASYLSRISQQIRPRKSSGLPWKQTILVEWQYHNTTLTLCCRSAKNPNIGGVHYYQDRHRNDGA